MSTHSQKANKFIYEQLEKYSNDPIYFIENALNKKLRPFQKEIIELLISKNNRKLAILAARQIGTTEVSVLYMLWFAIFYGDKSILFGSNTFKEGSRVLNKIKENYDNLPLFIKNIFPVTINMANHIRFKNGSEIEIVNPNACDFLCSQTADLLVIDNAMFINSFTNIEILNELNCVLSNPNSKILLTSSADDRQGVFSHIWKKETKWLKKKYIFNHNPNWDYIWLLERKMILDVKSIARDMFCLF